MWANKSALQAQKTQDVGHQPPAKYCVVKESIVTTAKDSYEKSIVSW